MFWAKKKKSNCCAGENSLESQSSSQYIPKKVNKQLPPKVLEPIVQNKIIEIPKEVYLEKIIEVPQIKTVERIVEQIRPYIQYKNVYKAKPVYVEKVKNVDKIIYQEKIIEVPQIKTVEKYVDVPVYVNKERIIERPQYMIIEKVIPVLKTKKSEKMVVIPEVALSFEDIEVEEKEKRMEMNDLKENETMDVTEQEVEELNQLKSINSKNLAFMEESLQNIQNAISKNDLTIQSGQDITMDTLDENRYCAMTKCNFNPVYQGFQYPRPSFYNPYFPKKQRYSNVNIYKSSDVNFPKIRISKTPHHTHSNDARNCYCNCA
ncbi:inner membrane complex protein 1g, putative [Hepatocystis sp. ex Piliocolobus tephrosceles]|nr:inner membrane complex protein 1g, putative [Hepatocystis sp. ex Piliocolobus tephrosceles]